jgi:hypothetical protein
MIIKIFYSSIRLRKKKNVSHAFSAALEQKSVQGWSKKTT